MFVRIIDYITILVSCFLLFKTIKKKKLKTRYVYYIVFFVIYVVPVVLDYTIGFPNYYMGYMSKKYLGFIYSQNDFRILGCKIFNFLNNF